MLKYVVAVAAQLIAAAPPEKCNPTNSAHWNVWAVPPQKIQDMTLRMCTQTMDPVVQACVYTDKPGGSATHCVVAVDVPGEPRWKVVPVDCQTGEAIKLRSADDGSQTL